MARPEPQLLFGHDEKVAEWVSHQIPHLNGSSFGPCRAIGVFNSSGTKLLAGVVYHEYQPEYETCQLSMAAVSPFWATRGTIRALLSVPFDQYGVYKVWTATPAANVKALEVNYHIGFKREGVLGSQFGRGNHAIICRMFEPTYRRIYCNG